MRKRSKNTKKIGTDWFFCKRLLKCGFCNMSNMEGGAINGEDGELVGLNIFRKIGAGSGSSAQQLGGGHTSRRARDLSRQRFQNQLGRCIQPYRSHNSGIALRTRAVPYVEEANTPQPMDMAGEFLLYNDSRTLVYLADSQPDERSALRLLLLDLEL